MQLFMLKYTMVQLHFNVKHAFVTTTIGQKLKIKYYTDLSTFYVNSVHHKLSLIFLVLSAYNKITDIYILRDRTVLGF